MGILQVKKPEHKKLVGRVKNFLRGNTDKFPDLGRLKFKKQAYMYALVLDTIVERIDTVIEKAKERFAEEGSPITCSAGCSACCSQPISIMFPEVFLMGEYLEQHPDIKKRFLDKYPAWRAKIDPYEYDQTMQETTYGLREAGEGVSSAVSSFYSEKAVPCPFLEKDLCDIYPARPIVCRQNLVLTPPENCSSKEKVALAKSGDLDQLIFTRATPLMLHILSHLGLKGGFAMCNGPLTAKEYVTGKADYVNLFLADAKKQMGGNL
ncbi:YkgJ family cysteine cluster protein [Candidatus Woesearchaeota archaeon]|nr:YkgJ family cysteine cluster protein [Candidatus Woesearchaeota archaeon]